ncbi:hypothetical protein GALMADRAFT_146886 [Galerina marginata CBS 339.88]|uniref:Uncharacterized protein n=1 Tax=Galerina marginata (strain CBS 339.88) TaxID=685588 RepID=A0A067SAH1_GALM3|nr:hypothetical protein GALMADRAFT_146886 [Galerina marginata CBS 339.88]
MHVIYGPPIANVGDFTKFNERADRVKSRKSLPRFHTLLLPHHLHLSPLTSTAHQSNPTEASTGRVPLPSLRDVGRHRTIPHAANEAVPHHSGWDLGYGAARGDPREGDRCSASQNESKFRLVLLFLFPRPFPAHQCLASPSTSPFSPQTPINASPNSPSLNPDDDDVGQQHHGCCCLNTMERRQHREASASAAPPPPLSLEHGVVKTTTRAPAASVSVMLLLLEHGAWTTMTRAAAAAALMLLFLVHGGRR